jgi:hypothetical protein
MHTGGPAPDQLKLPLGYSADRCVFVDPTACTHIHTHAIDRHILLRVCVCGVPGCKIHRLDGVGGVDAGYGFYAAGAASAAAALVAASASAESEGAAGSDGAQVAAAA